MDLAEKEIPGYELYEALLEDSSEEEPEPKGQVLSEDVIGMVYTSGTTGGAKGCIHTHRTFLGWAFLMRFTRMQREEMIACLIPTLCFIWGDQY